MDGHSGHATGSRGRGGWSPAAVGARGDLRVQSVAERPLVLRAARPQRPDPLRHVSEGQPSPARAAARWDAGVPLRAAHPLGGEGGVPAHRGRFALHGGGGAVAARLREGEGRPRQGRAARPGAQTAAAPVPAPHRRRHEPRRRGPAGHHRGDGTPLAGRRAARAADPRAGRRRGAGDLRRSRAVVPGRGTGPRDHRPGRRLAGRSLDLQPRARGAGGGRASGAGDFRGRPRDRRDAVRLGRRRARRDALRRGGGSDARPGRCPGRARASGRAVGSRPRRALRACGRAPRPHVRPPDRHAGAATRAPPSRALGAGGPPRCLVTAEDPRTRLRAGPRR